MITRYDAEHEGIVFQVDPDQIAANAVSSVGGGGDSTSSSSSPNKGGELAEWDSDSLRLLFHNGRITKEQWIAELVARGDTEAEAKAKVASADLTGRSTDPKKAGQFTDGEKAKMAAIGAAYDEQTAVNITPGSNYSPSRALAAQGNASPAVPPARPELGPNDAQGNPPVVEGAPPVSSSAGGGSGGAGGGSGSRPPAPAAPAAPAYTFGRDSKGLPVITIKATGQTVHLPPGTEADNMDVINAVLAGAGQTPLKFDYYKDDKGNPYIYVFENGKTIKLPPNSSEDSVATAYAYVNALDKASPNLPDAMASLEKARIDQGFDEFGRPYYDKATDTSTRYSAAPLPEALPNYMQTEMIRSSGAEAPYTQPRASGETGSSRQPVNPAHGLNTDVYGDPQFARLPSGNVVVDYQDAGNGVIGPVLSQGRVFANQAEAQQAETALGQEAASNSITTQMRREDAALAGLYGPGGMYEGQDPFPAQNTTAGLAGLNRQPPEDQQPPRHFAYGGSMTVNRPTFLVDAMTGRQKGLFGENGSETATFTPTSAQRFDPLSAAWNTGSPWNLGRQWGGDQRYHVGPNGPSNTPSVPPGFEGKTPTSNPNLVENMPRNYFYWGIPGSPPWLQQAQASPNLSGGSQNLLKAFQMMLSKPQLGGGHAVSMGGAR